MKSSNNTIILNGCIKEFQENNELSLDGSELFEIFATTMITKQYELTYEEINASIVDGGQDGGIDSFLILINDKAISSDDQIEDIKITSSSNVTLFIIQSKTEKTFTEATLDKLITSIPSLYNLELNEDGLLIRFNERLVEKILIFRKIWLNAIKKSASIKIEYCYACQANDVEASKAFNAKVEQIVNSTKEGVVGANVTHKNYSAKELLELYYKFKSSKLELIFKETPMSVTYRGGQIGYLGVADLQAYHSFLIDEDQNLRENIFENNIRHYQGDVDVNQMIQNTLVNDYERDFWWLNNGITIIASSVGQFGKSLTLEDVQIVNGLQTSFTIGKYYQPKDKEDRSILVKVIISQDKETIDQIISATNRQNPVSPILLRATDDRQRTIELYFQNKGYYYDRRKNYYKNQGKPASRIFGIQFTAQAIQAIMNFNPATARSKPTTLIKDDTSYNNIFRTDVSYDVYLNCCLVVQKVNEYIKNKLDPGIKLGILNFTYHLARIVTSIITGKSHYTQTDLKDLYITSINSSILEKATGILLRLIESYNKKYPEENIINISKSSRFVDEMNSMLKEMFIKP